MAKQVLLKTDYIEIHIKVQIILNHKKTKGGNMRTQRKVQLIITLCEPT